MNPRTRLLAIAALALPLSACRAPWRAHLVREVSGSAALFGQFRAYDGRTGKEVSFGGIVRRCRASDVILFGESHNDAICNQIEAELLYALAMGPRPCALAMEFFETDTQGPLDAYLGGRIAEEAFREMARQKRTYLTSHRPLIEFCRVAGIPVLAANTPRRLVRAYRKSGLPFDEYRAGLDPSEQCWLPTRSDMIGGPYQRRFFEIMKDHIGPTTRPSSQPSSQPSSAPASAPSTQPAGEGGKASAHDALLKSFRSQLLWDDTMAESVANFRSRHPLTRVMLIVGSFHAAFEGGTYVKFRSRRSGDDVLTIVYRTSPDPGFGFDEDDRGAGDIVIYGLVPPRPKKPTSRPTTTAPASRPTTAPASQPSTAPTTSVAPTSRPTTSAPS